METSFKTIKTALLSAPALGLPDVTKPFLLYVDEKQGVAKGRCNIWDLGSGQWLTCLNT